MIVSDILLLLVLVFIAFIVRAWFLRHPASWSRYVLWGLAAIWLVGLVYNWRAYH